MKKLLALTLVAGILGLTTGCPATETKTTAKSGTTSSTTKTEMKGGGVKKEETKTETKTEDKKPDGTKTETKTETKKTDEKPKKDEK